MPDPDRLAVRAGVVGPLVGFASTLAATTLSPTFRWTGNALSDLGATGAANPWLFNWGLVASALVTLAFTWALWTAADHPLQRLGALAFAASNVGLGLVGVFPIGSDLHGPVAVAYFTFLTATLWIHGSGSVLAGHLRRGLVAIWLGIGHVLFWIVWVGADVGGIAVPEIGGSLLLYAWILLVVRSTSIRAREQEFVSVVPRIRGGWARRKYFTDTTG